MLHSQQYLAEQWMCSIEWDWSQAQRHAQGESSIDFDEFWNSPEIIKYTTVLSYS